MKHFMAATRNIGDETQEWEPVYLPSQGPGIRCEYPHHHLQSSVGVHQQSVVEHQCVIAHELLPANALPMPGSARIISRILNFKINSKNKQPSD
eukprot:scaffold24252_cov23-Tisochrysis_lutea.AAC.6